MQASQDIRARKSMRSFRMLFGAQLLQTRQVILRPLDFLCRPALEKLDPGSKTEIRSRVMTH